MAYSDSAQMIAWLHCAALPYQASQEARPLMGPGERIAAVISAPDTLSERASAHVASSVTVARFNTSPSDTQLGTAPWVRSRLVCFPRWNPRALLGEVYLDGHISGSFGYSI